MAVFRRNSVVTSEEVQIKGAVLRTVKTGGQCPRKMKVRRKHTYRI